MTPLSFYKADVNQSLSYTGKIKVWTYLSMLSKPSLHSILISKLNVGHFLRFSSKVTRIGDFRDLHKAIVSTNVASRLRN